MSAMITTVNRVDGVYEAEVAVRLVIVKFNIYTDLTNQPFTDSSGSMLLSQNQTVCDGPVTANTGPGDAGYDIGHVFTTGGGGLASLGVVGQSGRKARGETGSSAPSGDAYDIDYVAHEIGHEFGAEHPFNAIDAGSCTTSTRAVDAAYEPGSGTTIMAYAGICNPQNVQPNSDPYFHTKSFDQIIAYTTDGGPGDTSGVQTPTGNFPPVVNAGANYTIPQGTPFTLTAVGSSPNNNPLTYSWEEFDLGAPQATPVVINAPYFRFFPPTVSPSRAFPNMNSLLANTPTPYEVLPTTDQTLNFRITARDNKAGGGVNYAAMQVVISGAPFTLANRTSTFSWNAGTTPTVTWTVGGGSVASNVDILLSTNGGATFTPLVSNVPNSGSATVTVPAVATTTGRLKIQSVGNIFFDVSRADFTIVNSPTISGTLAFEGISQTAPAQNVTFTFRPKTGAAFTQTISVPASGIFSLTNIPPAVYDVRIKGDKYLAQLVAVDTTAGNVSGVTSNQRAGDANNDNSVDSTDFGILIGAFNTSVKNAGSGYDAKADLNSDGSVDSTDFGLLIGEFNIIGSN